MKTAHFGFGADLMADELTPLTIGDAPLTVGETPSVGLNRSGDVVLVYEHSRGEKRYCVGRLDQATIQWAFTMPAGHGITPRVALNNNNVVVEVHRNPGDKTLYCRAGTLDAGNGTVTWPHARRYAEGGNRTRPSVALSDAGVVVEVHEVHEGKKLWLEYNVGQVKESGGEQYVQWSDKRFRGAEGAMPAIAINQNHAVVEVHRYAYGNDARLFFSVGRATGTKLDLRPRQLIKLPNNVTANGHYPAVAITDEGLVIVVLRRRTGFEVIELVGQLSPDGKTVVWNRWWYYDDGTRPCVAAAGAMAVEFHQHEKYRSLRFSTSIITNRASWMQDRLATLGPKPLRDLVLPASHDAGMYRSGDPTNISKNQHLTVYEQLRYGIRYFDLRPMLYPNNPEGELWVHHGGFGGPLLQVVLDDVARFANEKHRELVILKFSHFHHITTNAYRQLVTMVVDTIGKWLVKSKPNEKRLADVTLNEYVKDKDAPAVLVVVDNNFAIDNRENGLWVYRNWNHRDRGNQLDPGDLCVKDSYANTEDFERMRRDQHDKFGAFEGIMDQRGGGHRKPCDLFLLSWTLTPKSATTPLQLSRRANPSLGQNHRLVHQPPSIPNRHDKIINLIYVDYVESARVTDVALFLNGERATAADEPKPPRRGRAAAMRRTM